MNNKALDNALKHWDKTEELKGQVLKKIKLANKEMASAAPKRFLLDQKKINPKKLANEEESYRFPCLAWPNGHVLKNEMGQ